MPKLLSEANLALRLNELIESSSSIDIATAWISLWDGTQTLLEAARKKKVTLRILVGIGGYLTDPQHLKAIAENAELRIYGKPTGKLFHPKLFLFKGTKQSICWVGSANFTHHGFHKNTEVIAEFPDIEEVGKGEFERLWNSDEARPFALFDLDGYADKRTALLKSVPESISAALNLPVNTIEPNENLDFLMGDWAGFADRLRQIKPDIGKGFDLEEWLYVLENRNGFVQRNWEDDLTPIDLKMMYGMNPFAPFGRLDARNKGKFIGAEGKQRRREIGRALRDIASMKLFQAPLVQGAYENLRSVDGCGHALATRLLTLARPDWFVVVNKKSIEGLSRKLDVPLKLSLTAKIYAELLEKIQRSPWCNSPEPNDSEERRWWKYRTALIDPLVYNGNDPAVYGKGSVEFDD
jgi:hypothetical protein